MGRLNVIVSASISIYLLMTILVSAPIAAEVPETDPAVAAAVRSGSFKDAAALLEKRATSGDREAQYQLASLYRSGRGIAQDDALAFKWMKAAAELGHPKAQYSLATMYLSGRGALVDTAAARAWLKKAAAQGHEQALRLSAEISTAAQTPKAAKDAAGKGTVQSGGQPTPMPEALLARDASKHDNTMTPFVEAAWRGQLKLVQRFLVSQVELEQKDEAGNTALALAAAGGHGGVVDVLVTAGALVKTSNTKGETPLILAITKQKPETAALLIKAGSDINAKTVAGETPLSISVRNCNSQLVEMLIKAGVILTTVLNGETLLMHAAANCDGAITGKLLEAGGQIDAKDSHGRTALWHAADTGNASSLRVLAAKGADKM